MMLPTIPTTASGYDTGELQGVTSATQLPSIKCSYFKLVPLSTNTGRIFLGKSTVTATDGTTDTTTGVEVPSGGDYYFGSMDLYYRICTDANQHCTYIAYY